MPAERKSRDAVHGETVLEELAKLGLTLFGRDRVTGQCLHGVVCQSLHELFGAVDMSLGTRRLRSRSDRTGEQQDRKNPFCKHFNHLYADA